MAIRRPRAGRHVLLTLGFAINMVVLAVAGLAMIPALIGAVGPRDWAEVAVAQAIGGFCGVITGYGWGLVGPGYVARATPAERTERYFESLRGRALVGVIVIPVGVGLLCAVIGHVSSVPILALFVTAAVALSPAWFYVGTSQPWTLIVVDTTPRALSTAVAIVGLHMGLAPQAAFCAQLAGLAIGIVVASLLVRRAALAPRTHAPWHRVVEVLSQQTNGMLAAGASAAFAALPVVLVGIVAPTVLPVYAVFDKVQRQFGSAVSPAVQVSQGFVARAEPAARNRAIRRVVIAVGALAVVGVAVFALLGPWFLHILVAQTIRFGSPQVVVLGVGLALILFEQSFGHAVLATAGHTKQLASATFVGGVVGLGLVCVGAVSFGATAALVGFVLGLAVTVSLEVAAYLRVVRSVAAATGLVTRNGSSA